MANRGSLFSLVLFVRFMCSIAGGESFDQPTELPIDLLTELPIDLPTLSVINGLPQQYTAEPLHIRIKSQQRPLEDRILGVGESFQIPVATPTTYYLDTNIGSKYASVRVYEPGRDDGHSMVYSLVKLDGFYLSYDQVTWQLIDTWG